MFKVRVTCSLLLCFIGAGYSQTGEVSGASEYSVHRLGINTDQNDYSPVLLNGDIVFTSEEREMFGVYVSPTGPQSALSGMYLAKRVNDTLFDSPVALDNTLNRFYNSGPACFENDGKRVFFSSNEETRFFFHPSKTRSKLRIYTSEAGKKRWSERTLLSFGNDTNNYTHPFLTGSGDTLYFTSDRPGGSGGYDLYFSVRANGSWSDPVNAGPGVNSAADELFPSVAGNQLFFSSNRGGGYGALDLYMFDRNTSTSVHLGEPFNSPSDDFGYYPAGKQKGYFTSSRSGNDDIYFYRELFPAFDNCQPYEKDKFCFTFFEETEELEEGTNLVYEWSMGDGTMIKGREAKHCFDGYGEYLVELNIIDESTDALFFTESSYDFVIEPSEKLHIHGPDTVPLSAGASWNAYNSILPGYIIDSYYWEADQGAIRKSKTDSIFLTFNTPGTHELLMGVTAEPEEGGDMQEFCISKQITVLEGYQPIVKVKRPLTAGRTKDALPSDGYTLFLGVSDTLLENASIDDDTINVERLGDSLYLYSMGTSGNKLELLDNYREAQEMGFSDSRVTETNNGELVYKDMLAETKLLQVDTLVDQMIGMEQIVASCEVFYGYNIDDLTPGNKRILKDLVDKNPVVRRHRILISSFTDSKGDDEYNLGLSKRRSESVKQELIARGYPANQIETEFYGKRIPQDMQPFTDAERRKSLIIIYEKY